MFFRHELIARNLGLSENEELSIQFSSPYGHNALRADFSTATSSSGTSALGNGGIRAAFGHFPLVIDHPIGRVPETPYPHLASTVRTDQGVSPCALLIPLPIG